MPLIPEFGTHSVQGQSGPQCELQASHGSLLYRGILSEKRKKFQNWKLELSNTKTTEILQ